VLIAGDGDAYPSRSSWIALTALPPFDFPLNLSLPVELALENYRSARELLVEVKRLLAANNKAFSPSFSAGRRY